MSANSEDQEPVDGWWITWIEEELPERTKRTKELPLGLKRRGNPPCQMAKALEDK